MRLRDARTGIELIDRALCLRLLANDEIGRLAVVSGGAPVLFPVNYALDGEAIVFRTAPGTKLEAAGRAPACFEIDAFDRSTRHGWSVVVTGRLEEVDEHAAKELARMQALGVSPWAEGEREHFLRLVPDRITGRRVGSDAELPPGENRPGTG
jgi:nitroimidazol reductase NimA-like FMN-containing flavoprotein (pyridoxamine 5'-phosphate oxidase superfamily)